MYEVIYLSLDMFLERILGFAEAPMFAAILTLGLFGSFVLQMVGLSRRQKRRSKYQKLKREMESGEIMYVPGEYTYTRLIVGQELNEAAFKDWDKKSGNIYELESKT